MQIRNEHITGFVIGLGAAAAGFYFYKKNQPEVDAFLKKHGIDLPAGGGVDAAAMTLEQLVAEKERLEDIIAEREYAAEQEPAPDAEPTAAKPPRAAPRKKTSARKSKAKT